MELGTLQHERGRVNDALALYFADVTFANAFVSPVVRASQKVEIGWGVSGPG
jgi:hypothetical protein